MWVGHRVIPLGNSYISNVNDAFTNHNWPLVLAGYIIAGTNYQQTEVTNYSHIITVPATGTRLQYGSRNVTSYHIGKSTMLSWSSALGLFDKRVAGKLRPMARARTDSLYAYGW